ncbi:hypothetical protein [Streptomyces avicenniae]|uniref:hypothetical protein n=1 Tax=Streptomyces avicenniae TaxID=500153 RepID=UPI00069C419D|nr:hypothetical protein [Streptomyces avicenniae]
MRISLALTALASGALVALGGVPAAGAATVPTTASGHAPVFTTPALPPGIGQLLDTVQIDPYTTWAFGMHRGEDVPDSPLLLGLDTRTDQGWQEIELPAYGGGMNEINAATAVPGSGGAEAWLVGLADLEETGGILTYHLTDGVWRAVTAPLPPKAEFGGFSAVSALAPDDVWAVGWADIIDSRTPHPTKPGGVIIESHFEALVEHWDGTSWQQVAVPDPAAFTPSSLLATGPGELWIGGWDENGHPALRHLDDGVWTTADLPATPGGGELYGLAAGADGTLWAVGRSLPTEDGGDTGTEALVLRDTGDGWERVPTPDAAGRLKRVAVTPGGVTVVGERVGDPSGLVMRLTGDRWTLPVLPDTDADLRWINGVSLSPTGRLTFVGATADEDNPILSQPLVLHSWN